MHRHVIVLALVSLAGCQDTNRAVRQTPADATPGAVALIVGDFTDTDQNRFRDSTNITAYVYAAGYPIPLAARGSFEFELQSTRGAVLGRWMFDEKSSAAAMHQMAPGPGFIFNLSLLGADRIELSEGEIVCTFRPASGTPIHARPSAPVAIGPITRPRSSN